jgi:hypothetical protein
LARQYGLLCFSRSWDNPLLWSHYADRHKGIALGFDFNKHKLKNVSYVSKRPPLKGLSLRVAQDLLFKKYIDWRYEQEVRTFTSLEDADSATGLYLANFNKDCTLREVIVGPLCNVTKSDLLEALGGDHRRVTFNQGSSGIQQFPSREK